MEVIIGPAFDMDAYNDGVKGNKAKGVLSAEERGVLDMDRQYNAVNFQYFAQQADAGATKEGAEASFKRRLCTSRLSFYLEESHGSRIFPRNILSQLSLLFYRRNDALRLPNGQVNEVRVAVCIRKAIPRMLRAIVLDVFQGDRNFTPHMEKAVRVYLAVHQVAIKLLATFRKSFELLYQSVLEWIQQPFSPKSDADWPDLEELLLGSSLCSVPWSLLREAFVRKLCVQLAETTTMSNKAPMSQRAEHLFNQNRGLLERLCYILSFFRAGPGKLPVQEMDKKYSRCAGTLPKAERDALVEAAKEGAGISSLPDLWAALGMQRANEDTAAVLRSIERFLEYVQANVAAWRAAPAPAGASEGPALPALALEQLSAIAAVPARVTGGGAATKRERDQQRAQQLAQEKAQHKGFPKLPPSRRLDGTLCYYCLKRFPSRMALFTHLRRLIDKDRFVEGHHEAHYMVSVAGPEALPLGGKCKAKTCGKHFDSKMELWQHYHEMGVPNFADAPTNPADQAGYVKESHLQEDTGPDEAPLDMSQCAVCLDKPANVVMVPCGHIFACQGCGQKLKECVFWVTAAFSIVAYLWLVLIVQVTTPNVIELWEALGTLSLMPVLIVVSYLTDIGWFSGVRKQPLVEKPVSLSSDGKVPLATTGPSGAYRQVWRHDLKRSRDYPELPEGSDSSRTQSDECSHEMSDPGVIVNHHGQPYQNDAGVLTFSDDVFNVSSGLDGRDVAVPVFRKNGAQGRVSCKYRTEGLSAVAGYDFKHVEGELSWDHGEETCQQIMLEILPKQLSEATDQFQLILEDVEGGAIFNPNHDGTHERCVLTLTILNENDELTRNIASVQMSQFVDKVINIDKLRLGATSWYEDIIASVCDVSDDGERASCTDWILHIISLPWKFCLTLSRASDACVESCRA
ncbi:unnamed protein product [Effrenium voratum]|nr:unnamed protein product [Effrenium voratum]